MPFRCHVDAVGGGYVTAYGPGLNYGSSGQECCFTIVGGGGKFNKLNHFPTIKCKIQQRYTTQRGSKFNVRVTQG